MKKDERDDLLAAIDNELSARLIASRLGTQRRIGQAAQDLLCSDAFAEYCRETMRANEVHDEMDRKIVAEAEEQRAGVQARYEAGGSTDASA